MPATLSKDTCDRAESTEVLARWVADARAKTLALIEDLSDNQLMVPKLPTVNPLLWELAHAAWFQDHWVLEHAAGLRPIRRDGDRLFDSIGISHDVRWDLPVPSRQATLDYVGRVRDEVLQLLDRGAMNDSLLYFVKLSVFHEDMHAEAFAYTRQTLGYPPPPFPPTPPRTEGASINGDANVPGGEFLIGAPPDAPFVFDNEKWAHPVYVEPFAIARAAVTQAEFREFVDDHGYARRNLWSEVGWAWRRQAGADHPVFWRRESGGTWLRRHFDRWLPLDERAAMIHVNWHEAEAFCRWAGRRLPTEAEWELAAAGANESRHYPWGDEPPSGEHANLDWQATGSVDVAAQPAGDSACGCRQLFGNVWEWTADTFSPYPGFAPDPYKEYSRSCFGECKVLRGGCWASRSRMLRNTWRNFYRPDRRDVLAGFRTCAK